MIPEFPHKPPSKEYSYEYEEFNTRMIRIWLCCSRRFDYNLGKPTKTVWGFYNSKKRVYYTPINAKTIGKEVNIEDTRNYTAMPIKQTSLEACFV
jgi:hypothetical protein